MGKTVPAYRWALKDEIATWKGFRKALSSDEDRKRLTTLWICAEAMLRRATMQLIL